MFEGDASGRCWVGGDACRGMLMNAEGRDVVAAGGGRGREEGEEVGAEGDDAGIVAGEDGV